MISTNVEFYDNCVVLRKEGCKLPIIVMRIGYLVVIATPNFDGMKVPLINLVKDCGTEGDAYEKEMYLVGKMCKKSPDSKYFNGAKKEHHFTNGDRVSEDTQKFILKRVAMFWEGLK